MRAQLSVLAIAPPIFFFVHANPPALAQAGSTGGTVGKQDKSASGGEELAAPKSLAHKSASAPAECNPKASGCGSVAAANKWPGGKEVVKAVGTPTLSLRFNGMWTCANGQV